MRRIESILVANRGEIALRVMRTARAMGLRTIAVYSDADANAPHVQFADEAVRLGPGPVQESYLDPAKVIEAARVTGAAAIHPGYGFLSENAAFARAVEDADVIFVGPPAAAIDAMGDKAKAKRLMIDAGVQCVPGYEGEDQSEENFIARADEIGFPVMVKAAAGGGGRGMRLVAKGADLPDALRMARSEAENAFGSGELILEKAVQRARHVEVQVFADRQSNVIHLGERDCSVQRRHQKVLEEAPCPVMTENLRKAMGAAAVDAAKAVDYVGAGTVEFLLGEDGEFYFLEMNTRLQVEHPVTEMVTGLDLVALQIRIAQGVPLGLAQGDIALKGHAIEARLYAEDPANEFRPSSGPVALWVPPVGEGVRTDAGIETGNEISPFYDSMVAKIVVWADTRDDARVKLIRALEQTRLFGVTTNRGFLIDALGRDRFAQGAATTGFVDEVFGDGIESQTASETDHIAAAIVEHLWRQGEAAAASLGVPEELLNWSNTLPRPSAAQFAVGDEIRTLLVTPLGRGAYQVSLDGNRHAVAVAAQTDDALNLVIEDVPMSFHYQREADGTLFLQRGGIEFALTNLAIRPSDASDAGGSGNVLAPMHGNVLDIHVREGDVVDVGSPLVVLEAMKMQQEIAAEVKGRVQELLCAPGEQVAANALLISIDRDDS